MIQTHPLGVFCDTDPSLIMRMGLYHKICLEDGSASQNTPTLIKNLSDSNTNTWTFGSSIQITQHLRQYLQLSCLVLLGTTAANTAFCAS